MRHSAEIWENFRIWSSLRVFHIPPKSPCCWVPVFIPPGAKKNKKKIRTSLCCLSIFWQGLWKKILKSQENDPQRKTSSVSLQSWIDCLYLLFKVADEKFWGYCQSPVWSPECASPVMLLLLSVTTNIVTVASCSTELCSRRRTGMAQLSVRTSLKSCEKSGKKLTVWCQRKFSLLARAEWSLSYLLK